MISPKLIFSHSTPFNSSIIDAVWLIRENNEVKLNTIKELEKTQIKYQVFNKKLAKRSLNKIIRETWNHKSKIDSTNVASKYFSVYEVF